MTLLDQKKVKSARLESGTGRMYFEMRPAEEQAAAAEASTTAATNSAPAAKQGKNANSSSSQAAQTAAAPVTATAEASSTADASTSSAAAVKSVAARFKKQVSGGRREQFRSEQLCVFACVFVSLSFSERLQNSECTRMCVSVCLPDLFHGYVNSACSL